MIDANLNDFQIVMFLCKIYKVQLFFNLHLHSPHPANHQPPPKLPHATPNLSIFILQSAIFIRPVLSILVFL